MNKREEHINLADQQKINFFLRSLVLLFLFIVLSKPVALFSQIITNTGASISVSGNTFVNSKDLNNTSGTLGNNGIIDLSGNYYNGGTSGGNGLFNLIGNWTNMGSFNAGTSTVNLHGITNQTITHGSAGETFYILIIDNPGRIITQVANAGSSLSVLNNLYLNAGNLSLGTTTANLTIGGTATIAGTLTYNNVTPQTSSVAGVLSGSGTINMSGGSLPHVLNLAGSTSSIGAFITSPSGASTVNYNGTDQTVFAAPNYRNLTISNSGIKILQGNSTVGLNLNISAGTFDLGATTALGIFGNADIAGALRFSGGTAKTVSLTGNLSGSGAIDMSGANLNHLLNLAGSTNNIGSYTSGNGSTVNYLRNDIQTLFTSENYRNLTISGAGLKTLQDDISASGILTMSAGNINSDGHTLKITNSATGAINRSAGHVIGKLQRAIGVTSGEYLYPLGTSALYNPMKMTFQSLVNGPLTAEFKPDDIGTAGLPLDDDGNEIFDVDTTGYWSLTSVQPMATSSFDVKLTYAGFPEVDQSSSIIKRTDGGNLEVDGTHGTITGTEISRTVLVNGISTTTTDLAIGRGRPRITAQPQNIDICEGSDAFFEVNARGRGTLTYQWQVNTGSGFINLFNVGVYSGVTTKKLILTAAPYSMNGYIYRCIITDGQGSPNITNEVLLTVNKIPVAVASPVAQNVCPGVAFMDIELSTSNDVPGTTFAWSRTSPAGISTTLLASGSTIGDKITGTFTNTTDTPITVVFTIIPTGPATTFCVGNAITVSVTVNPTPRVFASPPNSIQCDSTTTSIQLTSPSTFTSGFVSFKYSVTTTGTTGSVTGFTTPLSGMLDNHVIADKLINHTDNYQVVTYRVVPVSPVGCIDGPALEVKVTVDPTPRVIPVNLNPSICYGDSTRILLTTPTVMTSGVIRFDYDISVSGAPGIVNGVMASNTNLEPGDIISFPYTNSSDTIQSVYYSIRPKVVGLSCNAGNIVTPEVKVHAIPVQDILVTVPLTCSGGTGLAALQGVISEGADPYHIAWDGPVGYHSEGALDISDLSSGKYVLRVTDNLGCFMKDSISIVPVTARAYISAEIKLPGNYNLSCIGSTDGRILVAVTGGITPPYNYTVLKDGAPLYSGTFTGNLSLSDPNTYKYYYGLGAGTYTLAVTDVNGCVNTNSSVFRVPPPVVVSFGSSNATCKGYDDGSAWISTITGGRGYFKYRWYSNDNTIPGPVNTNRIDGLEAGIYYLEVTDTLGCITIASVTITEPDGMELAAYQLSHSPDGDFNISCKGGNDGAIDISVAGGSGAYLYSWSGSNGFTATTRDISGLKEGDYTCAITDVNGCILTPSPSYTLTEPDLLTISNTTSVSGDGSYEINCNGGTGSIDVTVSGGSIGTYKYTWSTIDGSGLTQGQEDQSGLTAGTYNLVVTDSNNCVAQKEIVLHEPPAFGLNLVATNITCQSPGFNNGSIDLNVSGGVAPYDYTWSNGASGQDISGLTEGYYTVTVEYNNTCSKTDSVRINLPPPLEYSKALSDYNGFNISCNGLSNGSISIEPLSGEPPFIYNWTGPGGFSATTSEISDLPAGEYFLLITDNNYCTTTEAIVLSEPGQLGIGFDLSESIAGGFNINCAGDSTATIEVNPVNNVLNVSYIWSDGVTGKVRNGLPEGDYNVVITDDNNCSTSSGITLTQPDSLKLVFDITQPFCPDKPDGEIRLNVTGGVKGTDYTYRWSDNSNGSVVSDILKGYYKVTVNDLNGCIIKDSVIIEPLYETCLIIPNAISPNDDLINDVWNIGMIELYPQMEVKIFNRWGESIWVSQKGYPQPWDGRSNGEDLPIDSYHYIIDLHNGSKPLVGNITIVR